MTVANTNVSSSYNCNGVTREWDIGFHYNPTLSGLDIVVLHADGTSTTVSANYEIEDNVLTYPTVESELDPLPEGDVITITRITPLTQNINLVQQGPLDAETLESGYDKATLQIQEVLSKKQDKLKAGANILIDPDGTISATGEIVEGVSWGNVHGTLSNQTDLLTALNAKQDVSNLVTSLSASSTDTQYPSAKVAYDNFELKQPKTLSEPITVNGQSQTTVEGTLNAINENSSIANTSLSNLTSSGENHFVQLQSGVSQADVDYIVESYQSGTSWYRVYKSGWCEQGGYVTRGNENIYLLKEFADTNYSIFTTFDASSHPLISSGYSQKATDNFYLFVRSYGQGDSYDGICWEAKGYIENSSGPGQ